MDRNNVKMAQKTSDSLGHIQALRNTIVCNCVLLFIICATNVDKDGGVWYDISIKGRAVGGPKLERWVLFLSEVISLAGCKHSK